MKTILNSKIKIVLFICLIIFLCFCKKEEVPILTTAVVTNITGITATSGGTITSEGSGTVISRGVCWSTNITPTIEDNKTQDGAGAGTFQSNMVGLNGGTTYYVRAYATNRDGPGYGMAMSFITLGQSPTAITGTASSITIAEAKLNGTINGNYLPTTVTFEYGTTITYDQTITATQSPVLGNVNTSVSSNLVNLSAGTTYHFRVKAVNSLGTTYGSDMTLTTLGLIPTVTTLSASNFTATGAKLNGTVKANYLSSIVTFEYGTTDSYGQTITADQSPVTGNVNVSISANLTSLISGSTYHFRVKAVNSLGTSYGIDNSFITNLTVGLSFEGGLICYLDNTGQHGLIAAPTDQSIGIQWYNSTNIPINTTGLTIGTGQANTTAIVTAQGVGNYAAKICDDLVLNNYSDWFLPSKDELNTIYTNLKAAGLGGFSDGHYWTSSEFTTKTNAWYQYFALGSQNTAGKEFIYYVRAVRAF